METVPPQPPALRPEDLRLVLEVLPSAISALGGLLEQANVFKNRQHHEELYTRLGDIRTAICCYAAMHYALKDWKNLHEGLHELSMQLPGFIERAKSCNDATSLWFASVKSNSFRRKYAPAGLPSLRCFDASTLRCYVHSGIR